VEPDISRRLDIIIQARSITPCNYQDMNRAS